MKIIAKLKAVLTLADLSPQQKKNLLRSSLTLLAVCTSAALLLSGINELVYGIIEGNLDASLRSAMERVILAEEYDRVDFEFEEAQSVSAIYEAKTGEELIGYCVEATAADYGGEMTVLAAVDAEGKVMAVEVMSMPDGIGTKVKDEKFLSQFVSKGGKLTAVLSTPKDGTQISAISGATTSSNAVTECVNHAVAAVSQLEAEKAKEAAGE